MNTTTRSKCTLLSDVRRSVNVSWSRRAWEDLREGIHQWELWGTMGLQEIKRRYRRSILGPLWLTLSLAILVGTISVLYGQLMDVPPERYVPHLALGFVVWQFIQGVVGDSCSVFIAQKGWITNARRPLSLFVFKMVWQNALTMSHNSLVFVGVAIIFGIVPGIAVLALLPGLILVAVNAVWVGLFLGTLCARFRDVPQIVMAFMRVAFYVTPVIWMPDQLGSRAHLAHLNPFTYFIDLVRGPLTGQMPSLLTWGLACCVTVAGWAVTWLFFSRFRARVPYWL